MKKLRLILGDQLNINHSWFNATNNDCIYLLMEIKQETSYVKHHIQKLIGIFAAMRNFYALLISKGFKVVYISINDTSNKHNSFDNIKSIVEAYEIEFFEYQQPDEYRLDQIMKEVSDSFDIPTSMVSTEHFFTEREEVKEFFSEKKQWRMENFYRFMRKKFRILMRDEEPEGGKWNYDAANRKAWRGDPEQTDDFRPEHDHSKILEEIDEAKIEYFGSPQQRNFRWPINRDESIILLNQFIKNDLNFFGDYQDAMHTDNWRLFHSFLSFSLNTKMISPAEVINLVECAYAKKEVSINSAEGFIRQILGWREYIRGVYWANMPGYSASNFFNCDTDMPNWFWDGKTKMNCMSKTITQSLEHAYAHHIQRLMITGNFSLLAGIDPQQVHHWYLGIYIDAFEWVELPNTLGMSQYADGGLLASKPYVSSAAYINKMSNYCSDCFYNYKEKITDNACPFNALYWNFFEKNHDKLSKNPRLGIVNSQLKKMDIIQIKEIKERAKNILNDLDKI